MTTERNHLTPRLGYMASVKQSFSAPYKHIPVYPLVSPALDFSCSSIHRLQRSCLQCFPQPLTEPRQNYVDLLEFSRFGGMPYPILPGACSPSPWFADLRYTIATPLPHSYPRVQKEVMESKRVTCAVEAEAQNPNLSKPQLRRKLRGFFMDIRATVSRFICKICGYLLFKVFRHLMSHLLVSPQQLKRLTEAEKTGIPLVYLPLHRSHLDYLLITWTAWHFGLRLPHIASGDNLNLSGLGWLLRSTGAFFIKRPTNVHGNRSRDSLYRAVLHSYIEQLLNKGLSIEFFLEGTRCRFGKSQLPKHGLISNVIQAVQQKAISNCYLVPVSYTYDNIAEGVFLDELIGIPKKRESVFGVLHAVFKSFGKSRRCGAVRLHFGSPVLLSDYLIALQGVVMSHNVMPQLGRMIHSFSYRELIPWHTGHTEKASDRNLIRAIGYHVLYEAQSMASISLVSVLSALLLCKFRKEVSVNLLSADCQWLCDQIILAGSDVMGWRMGQTCGRNAVEYALPYLANSVDRHFDMDAKDDVLVLNSTHRQLLSLAYYKNALVPLFALQSAVGLAMISRPLGHNIYSDVIEDVALICDWMQFEVIFCKPCENIREVIMAVVGKEGLSRMQHGLLNLQENEDDFAGGDGISVQVRDSLSYDLLMFYSNFLRPFLQSLYIVIDRLLLGDLPIEESETIRNWCQFCATPAYYTPFPLMCGKLRLISEFTSPVATKRSTFRRFKVFAKARRRSNARHFNEIVDCGAVYTYWKYLLVRVCGCLVIVISRLELNIVCKPEPQSDQ
ncbi:hypothetical protein Angca_006173 [Angiostrongylus cantonensis]|nr:hypothetical protein Angca_006173 [Angiostrongylus cantonensis]